MHTVTRQLQLHYLGKRAYIQGTTLFDSLSSILINAKSISFRLHKPLMTDRAEVVINGSSDLPKVATLDFEQDAVHLSLAVLPLTKSENPLRVDYDESCIVDNLIYSNDCVKLNSKSPYSFLATVTAINKAYLLRTIPSKGEGQWILCGVDLHDFIDTYTTIQIKIHTKLFGNKLIKSSITLDGQHAGEILFSWFSGRLE